MRNLDEILTDSHLELPVGEKTYRIRPLGYQDELRIKKATAATEAALKAGGDLAAAVGMDDDEFLRLVLGDVLDEMRADNLPAMVITRAALTAHTWNTHGLYLAEQMWENGPSPEALAASMQAAASQPDSTPSSSTAGAPVTRPRASTSGTRSRKATPRSAATVKKGQRSSGPRSSTSGR